MAFRLEKQYDLFVSYNKADIEFAGRLVKRVESESYEGRQLRCFFAAWDIRPGENILLRIEKAIEQTRYVALIMSPDWEKSNWATLERVIPVYEDPAGLKSRIIPILKRTCIIPPSIKILDWLDFRTEGNFEREARKLVSRLKGEGRRISKPLQTSVDSNFTVLQTESITSNLFPVLQLPRWIFVAHIRVRKRGDVWPLLGENTKLPPFAIRTEEQRIYSFANLKSPQHRLGELLSQPTTDRVASVEMLEGEDRVILIELLNRSMTEHMKQLGMTYDWSNKKTYYQIEDKDTGRYASWRVGGRPFKRFLSKRTKDGKDFVHRSCKATFTLIAGRLYLRLLPGFHFTSDGVATPVANMSSRSSRWMNLQRNHSILDDVRFWASVLSGGSDKISLYVGCDVNAEISSVPLLATIDRGIEGDYRERSWFETEPEDDEAEQYDESIEINKTAGGQS